MVCVVVSLGSITDWEATKLFRSEEETILRPRILKFVKLKNK